MTTDTQTHIKSLIDDNRIILFMKRHCIISSMQVFISSRQYPAIVSNTIHLYQRT